MSKTFISIVLFMVLTSVLFAQNSFGSATILPGANTDMSQSVVFGDYNNDGWTDLYISRGSDADGSKYVNYLYKNSSGTLSKQTIAGITDVLETSGSSTWGDYNNDGWLDLYVANAQPGPIGGKPRNTLLLNDGSGGFTNETSNDSYGPIVSTLEDARRVGWGDYNNDGYLDVFVKRAKTGIFGVVQEYSSFYENTSGTSSTIKTEAQIGPIVTTSNDKYKSLGTSFGWCDFNNDGYLDIYSAKGYGKDNTLWKNTGGAFVDDTPTSLRPAPCTTEGFSWGDFDNDGDFDLFTGTKPEADIKHSFIYQNSSTPSTTSFTDVTSSLGGPLATNQYYVQGSSYIDIDNDGDLDLFTATRTSDITSPPSILYENSGASGGYTFSQLQTISLDPGNGNQISEARGAAFADLDHDGYLDLIVARDGEPLLYMNAKSGNNFAFVKCVGTGTTNSSAIGTRVLITTNIPEQEGNTSQIREISGQTGSAGQDDLRTHFGLGSATKINELKTQWYNSTGGTTKQENIYTDLPIDKYFVFTQGDLSITSDVIKAQNFMYLFGNTGGAVEFTTSDADGGTLTMSRTNSDPGGTFDGTSSTSPGSSTITPNSVYPDKFWTVSQIDLTGFNTTVYFDASGLTGAPNLDDVVLLKRATGGSWTALNTSRIGNTLYASGINSFSEFAIGYEEAPQTVLLETKIFLQGAYDTTTDEMRIDILSDIPTTSPYSEDPRTVDPLPANIVDWVLVELRNTDTGSAVVSKSAFLHKDGRIVNDDATSGQIVMEAAPGNYYIVIKHRNHLSVMSANLVTLSASTSTLYDFTN